MLGCSLQFTIGYCQKSLNNKELKVVGGLRGLRLVLTLNNKELKEKNIINGACPWRRSK